MASATIDEGAKWIGSTPDGPLSVSNSRRGIPEGSASTSCAWRARITVQTSRNTVTLMYVGSRFVAPRARLKSYRRWSDAKRRVNRRYPRYAAMTSAATRRTGMTAHGLIQAAFRTTMANAMLAAVSMIVVRICEPVRRSVVCPYSFAMTKRRMLTVAERAMRAAAPVAQPSGLTGLCEPRSSR